MTDTDRIREVPTAIQEQELSKQSRFYKIDKLMFNKDENILEKLATVFNADYYCGGTLAMMIQNDAGTVSYYLGVINKDNENEDVSIKNNGQLLKNAFEGNFPGSELKSLKNSVVRELFKNIFDESEAYCISAISGIASDKIEDLSENNKFVQGMEKLIDATREESYTLLILADPLQKEQIREIRAGYETLYSQLAPFEKTELTLSNTEGMTYTEGISKSSSHTESTSHTTTHSENKSKSEGKSNSSSKTRSGLAGAIGRSLTAVGGLGATAVGLSAVSGAAAGTGVAAAGAGAAAAGTSVATVGALGAVGTALSGPAGIALIAGTMIAGAVLSGSGESKSTSKSENQTEGSSDSNSHMTGSNDTTTEGENKSTAESISSGRTVQITSQNRSVKSLLEKIDLQLERLKQCESFGTFSCAAYVVSNNVGTNHVVASMYNALMSGEDSGAEVSQVNTWSDEIEVKALAKFLSHGYHPEFNLLHVYEPDMIVTPASVVSGRELAIHMGLPKKSVSGLSVIESAEFGRNVYSQGKLDGPVVDLGHIFHMGQQEEANVQLDVQSLAMHTFITGSTGTGKSNTVYQLLGELEKQGKGFLIIEPAKGEYKHMFGNRMDVQVFGTNPYYMPLLKTIRSNFRKEYTCWSMLIV